MVMSNVGFTSTEAGDLDRGLDYTIDAARRVREHMGTMSRLCEVVRLKKNQGYTYNEPRLGQLEARDLPEHGYIDDPQTQYIEEVITIRPRGVGIQTVVTDTTRPHLNRKVWSQMGKQAQEAVTRKKDIDGLLAFNAAVKTYSSGDSFDMHQLRNFRTSMQAGSDPAKGEIRVVMHGFQKKAIEDEIVGNSNLGHQNYGEVTKGMTADVLKTGMIPKSVGGVRIFEDNNIRIRGASTDLRARAVIFPREGMLLVEDEIMTKEKARLDNYGEGAWRMHIRARYRYGSRRPDKWIAWQESDATDPIS